MANFVKWRGPHLDQGSPSISHSIQSTEVGKSYRFGLWGGDGLNVGPNDRSVAQLNPRSSVEGSTNNITWYELVGMREANVMIEARNSGDGGVWDYFQLVVKPATAKTKTRPAVRGINYNYEVDTKSIGPNTNASMILTLKMALIQVAGGTSVSDGTTSYVAQGWSPGEWNNWTSKFKSVIQRNWSEKFWISSPESLTELEVAKPGGGKSRVHLHCVLRVELVPTAAAQHRIKVVKSGAPTSQFRSNSTQYDKGDIKVEPPSITGYLQPFTAAVHEIGHTIGIHHPCETSNPGNPYCVLGHPDYNERMAQGEELRPRYATPWQNAAASWFNSSGHGRRVSPADFKPYVYRIAPADA